MGGIIIKLESSLCQVYLASHVDCVIYGVFASCNMDHCVL